MSAVTAARPSLASQYTAAFPTSKQRFEVAKGLFPCGVTHDTRMMEPFPIYIDRAKGSKKWDLDGHELIDYFVGHGSHLLGHSPDEVVEAVQRADGARYAPRGVPRTRNRVGPARAKADAVGGAGTIHRQRDRGDADGPAAVAAIHRAAEVPQVPGPLPRLARLRHCVQSTRRMTRRACPACPRRCRRCCVAIPPNDLNRVEDALRSDPQIGAVILEPTGGHWGAVPIRGEFLKGLREICTRHDRLLIFDEVITGFRVAPGGAQEFYGVKPDLTSLAKILAGGLPGGCLAGQAEILAFIEPRPGHPKMKHPGTYNANPLSAAAGVAALTRVASGEPCRKANAAGRLLRNRLNELFESRGWSWVAYGDFSMVRVLPGYTGARPRADSGDNDCLIPFDGDVNKLDGPKNMKQVYAMRQGMLLNGVDWWGLAGMTSCEHTAADVERTVQAMEASIELLAAEGMA